MKTDFETWMKQHERKKPNTAYQYAKALDRISAHYSQKTKTQIDLKRIRDPEKAKVICDDYALGARFASFGNTGNGTVRNAAATYVRYLKDQSMRSAPQEIPMEEEDSADEASIGSDVQDVEDLEYPQEEASPVVESGFFTYERDLQTALVTQIPTLFDGYKIYGDGMEGIEFSIGGKRIDVLLEKLDESELMAIELKAGPADFRVFGQMAMYLGLLAKEFPGRPIKGVIIAGEVDDSLRNACSITNSVSLWTYRMKLDLEPA